MNIAIVGFDVEGRASYDYFLAQNHQLTICDQNPDVAVPAGVASVLGEAYLDDLDRFDVIVRTAGLPPSKILEKNPGVSSKITTHINEFFKVSPTKNIIGVTGTKGKGTTSSLITAMLKADGKDVYLGGNIGVPPLTFLHSLTPDSWIVLELSSFQLIDLKYSPHLAVCLMVVPEHLNWHTDLNEYIAAKSQLFAHQTLDDFAIYFAGNMMSEQIAGNGRGQKLPYFARHGAFVENGQIIIDGQSICRVDELKLMGQHNWQNACAALTATWQISQDVAAIRSSLTTFSGLEHRLEFVREVNGVKYYDDSFGTTPETAVVAIQAFSEPKVVVLGGSDKGADYAELAEVVASNNVRSVILIGETAPKIKSALDFAGYINIQDGGSNMDAILSAIQNTAKDGDVALLSTANASFDMFKNYKDRGEQFKTAVSNLA
jgi:UDP-N-acetylmuramoylalanine--D-glutamate ligase